MKLLGTFQLQNSSYAAATGCLRPVHKHISEVKLNLPKAFVHLSVIASDKSIVDAGGNQLSITTGRGTHTHASVIDMLRYAFPNTLHNSSNLGGTGPCHRCRHTRKRPRIRMRPENERWLNCALSSSVDAHRSVTDSAIRVKMKWHQSPTPDEATI